MHVLSLLWRAPSGNGSFTSRPTSVMLLATSSSWLESAITVICVAMAPWRRKASRSSMRVSL
ncbi:hypothetical protein BC834DRAFT_848805 [Gloeopeniophorella convolvens]|nr:hypothetical protein BC834DRAFT_848805 [Gloeopeniophorella convolvens]